MPKAPDNNFEISIASSRHYSYDKDGIHSQLAAYPNSPDDRYSNGSIISVANLPGAGLEIRSVP